MAGRWTGSGTSYGTACTVGATVEPLAGGRHVAIWTSEVVAGQTAREELSIYSVDGERLVLRLYDSKGGSWREYGPVDPQSTRLIINGSGFQRTLEYAGSVLQLVWWSAGPDGAMVERLRWTLARGATRTAPAAGSKVGVEFVEFMQGDFKGSATSPGGAYEVLDSCRPVLGNLMQVSRQHQSFPDGHKGELTVISGEVAGKLIRHEFAGDGQVVDFEGQSPDIGKVVFTSPYQDGTLVLGMGST